MNLSGGGIRTEVWGISTDTPVPVAYIHRGLRLKTRRKIENFALGFIAPQVLISIFSYIVLPTNNRNVSG